MARIKINNKDLDTQQGLSVLESAREAGYNIPSLCFNAGLPHYTSCMVCLVKDNRTGSFFASCSVTAEDGMDLDVSSEEVISLRRKSLELLLSEHRAECEAPCRVVCPAGYNIPLFNRHLAAKDPESATELTLAEIDSGGIACSKCPGYCENACRRKKIDIPVSIRNMKLFIYSTKGLSDVDFMTVDNIAREKTGRKNLKLSGRFNSHIGRIEPEEQAEWLKECEGNSERFSEISSRDNAVREAASCMHCDCRAAGDCRLRDLAQEFSIKDPRGKLVNAPIVKKINFKTGLVFENAKCIKCGLCVRVCQDSKEETALCFINRGFISIISEPLTEEFDSILKTRSRQVIEICPTGALSQLKQTTINEKPG
jgi:predicted molibdopterin-dependent oxidoreductase YjgC